MWSIQVLWQQSDLLNKPDRLVCLSAKMAAVASDIRPTSTQNDLPECVSLFEP